jgi:uncharacterized membrane protein YhaH (DUF805 family)
LKFFEAVGKCLRKYSKFKGRASRREYWWFTFFFFLFAWPLALTTFEYDPVTRFVSFIYFTIVVLLFTPQSAVWTRRMHDIGRSGWSWLFIFIPLVGWILILKWLTKEGSPEANNYGPADNGTSIPAAEIAYKQWSEARFSPKEPQSDGDEQDLVESGTGQEVIGNGKMRRLRRNN